LFCLKSSIKRSIVYSRGVAIIFLFDLSKGLKWALVKLLGLILLIWRKVIIFRMMLIIICIRIFIIILAFRWGRIRVILILRMRRMTLIEKVHLLGRRLLENIVRIHVRRSIRRSSWNHHIWCWKLMRILERLWHLIEIRFIRLIELILNLFLFTKTLTRLIKKRLHLTHRH
jgi:hypothetical protein